jgi:tetratricopeptide (TPR) repeat protein
VLAARRLSGRALDEFARAAALDPHLGEARRRRGDLLWQGGDVDGSLSGYEEALKADPADVAALLGRGRALLAKGRHDEGLADLDEVVRRRPELAEAYLHRGGEKVRRNWVNKGAADLLEAVRRRPDLLGAALAEVERKAGDLPSADEAEAYRLMLAGLTARLDGELRRRVAACLDEAKGKGEAKRADLLREMIRVVRSKSAER